MSTEILRNPLLNPLKRKPKPKIKRKRKEPKLWKSTVRKLGQDSTSNFKKYF